MRNEKDLSPLFQELEDLLCVEDPEPILQQLGYDPIRKGNRIWFKDRDEKTPSANFFIGRDKGIWVFKDFGSSDKAENVITFIQKRLKLKRYEAMKYAAQILGNSQAYHLIEKIDEAINKQQEIKIPKKIIESIRQKNKIKRSANRKKTENVANHRVVYASLKFNEEAKKFLKNRGLDPEDPPKGFFHIKGVQEYVDEKTGEFKEIEKEGVGVLIGEDKLLLSLFEEIKKNKRLDLSEWSDKLGADIHLLKPYKNKRGQRVKSRIYGISGATFIYPEKIDVKNMEFAVFESKMDYYAAHNQIDLSKFVSVIANGVGHVDEITDKMFMFKKNGGDIKNIYIFNQNDIVKDPSKLTPSEQFVQKIADENEESKIFFVNYAKDEEGMDINDLAKEGIKIKDRIRPIELFKKKIEYRLQNEETIAKGMKWK